MSISHISKKLKALGVLLFFVLVIGGVLVGGYWLKGSVTIKEAKECSLVEFVYYIFNIIGVIFTFFAIVTALFKEDILGMIHKPDLNFGLVDDGISENTPNNGVKKSYKCSVYINNKGDSAVLGCKAFVGLIEYGQTEDKMSKVDGTNMKEMQWISDEVNIYKDIPYEIKIFDIDAPVSNSTPDKETTPKAKISFNGCELEKKKSESGFWTIVYYICSKDGSYFSFKLHVHWNGEFKNSVDEMKDVLTVKFL